MTHHLHFPVAWTRDALVWIGDELRRVRRQDDKPKAPRPAGIPAIVKEGVLLGPNQTGAQHQTGEMR